MKDRVTAADRCDLTEKVVFACVPSLVCAKHNSEAVKSLSGSISQLNCVKSTPSVLVD